MNNSYLNGYMLGYMHKEGSGWGKVNVDPEIAGGLGMEPGDYKIPHADYARMLELQKQVDKYAKKGKRQQEMDTWFETIKIINALNRANKLKKL